MRVVCPRVSTAWLVILTPCPAASYVSVCAFGAGPGSYLDLATSSFHVPIAASVGCEDRLMTGTTTETNAPTVSKRKSGFIVLLLSCKRREPLSPSNLKKTLPVHVPRRLA